jgi:hypothetical protein
LKRGAISIRNDQPNEGQPENYVAYFQWWEHREVLKKATSCGRFKTGFCHPEMAEFIAKAAGFCGQLKKMLTVVISVM